MGKSQETFNKKEKEKKRLKKRKEKEEKKRERKENASKGGSLEDMMAYVDENGQIVDTPPDPSKKKKVSAASIEISTPKKEDRDVPSARIGKIDFFNTEKGFGFIIEKGTGDKFFFHVNGLLEEVKENDIVTYELEQGLKGINAVRVKKTEEPK